MGGQRDTAQHLVRTAGQPPQHCRRIGPVTRLAEHVAVDHDDGVGAERGRRLGDERKATACLVARQPHHQRIGLLAGLPPLVDIDADHAMSDAELVEQLAASGRGGSKQQHGRSFGMRSLAVVGMAVEQRDGPVQLLDQHDAHQCMGQRQSRQRPALLRAGAHVGAEAVGPADRERETVACLQPLGRASGSARRWCRSRPCSSSMTRWSVGFTAASSR